jgi:hypothetical protein
MITQLTLKIAEAICSGEMVSLESFFKNGLSNQYFLFSHYNFYYSYPEWQKKWPNSQDCQYHRINVACHCCGKIPDRNYAGVGNIWLMKSKILNRDFTIFCNSCKNWRDTEQYIPKHSIQYQLSL